MRHAALWFGAGAEYLDADSLQTHTFLLEKAALSREPCLGTSSEGTEGADAFWSEGATLRISWERKLCIAFEAIRTRVTPVNLHKVRFCFFLPLFSTEPSAATKWQVAYLSSQCFVHSGDMTTYSSRYIRDNVLKSLCIATSCKVDRSDG